MIKLQSYLKIRRSALLCGADVLILLTVGFVSAYLCSAHSVTAIFSREYVLSILALVSVYTAVYIIGGVYGSIWRYAQLREYFVLYLCSVAAGLLYCLFDRLIYRSLTMPTSYYVIVMLCASNAEILMRLLYRRLRDLYLKFAGVGGGPKKRLMVVGAGMAALYLLNEIRINPYTRLEPVVAVDDDPEKLRRRCNGLLVAGNCAMIPALVKKYKIDLIYIAIPTLTNEERSVILGYCTELPCEVKILPRFEDIDTKSDLMARIRDITVDELLGRDQVKIEGGKLSEFVEGKTVLVTGGGGSIGSELCRQIAVKKPKKLVVVDIYENNAYAIQQELIREYGDSLTLDVLIASVRDYARIRQIMRTERPDLVIHAAAHKHVPLMEVSPQEAIKNNIFGTYNTARAADEAGVKNFILISTDKAVNPTNIMGATKRVCEMVIQTLAAESKRTTFAAVRFGNVLGSNGSVIPLFKEQIESGGPVTVTHPDITRFFMTIPEAAQLVLTAGAMAKGGEIFVLDMGKPVKIDTLAKQMISLAGLTVGRDIEIKYCGLRPGEKLYEELLMSEEGLKKTENQKIYVGQPIKFDTQTFYAGLETLYKIAMANAGPRELEAALMSIVSTFKRAPDAPLPAEFTVPASETPQSVERPVMKSVPSMQ